MSPKLRYERDGGIARITLNRPEKRNALDAEMIADLRREVAEAGADASVRVIVLAGAGKDFCSGADLASVAKACRGRSAR